MNKLLLLFLFPSLLFSQSWIDLMQDPSNNFYDTQKEFNDYWENKTIEKGKGWKQFKRWENFIEQRVFPDGVQHPELLLEEYNTLQEANNQFYMLPPNVWSQVGPDNVPLQANGTKRGIGRVNTIAFHPTDPNIIYVGAPAGGFWKSVNGGQTWQTSTDFLTNLGVSDIAINPSNPAEIFIITGDRDAGDTYSYGLMKSLDGGLTFNTTSLSFNITNYYKGNRVLIDPNNTNVLIVATSNGIYRSSDGGNTFVNTFSSANLTDIEFHTTNSNIIYGASYGNTSIYKSTDNGITWAQSGIGLPSTNLVVRACVAVTADNPSVVYALFGNNNNGFYGVYKSIDEGQNWTQQASSPNLLGWSTTGSDSDGQAWYDLAFAVDPNDEKILFVGGVNCWRSTDDGQNWSLNTHWTGSGGADYMHADEHMLKYNPLNNYIYSGNDGGLYVSTNNGGNWTDISDGLQISQFYSLGVSQTVQDKVITGAQDNGTFLKDATNWDAVIGGDGMECIIDYTNSNIMYGELYYGSIRKSTNGGNSFSTISSGNGAWETPYILDRTDPNTIYVGYDELVKSTDGGNNWTTITNNQTNGGKIDEITVSKSNPFVIYFSDGPNLYKTSDGGSNWSNISSGLPYKTIKYISIHPNDPGKVWVVFSGYTSGEKVYKSTNGGTSWQNYSGTLPNIPVNTIVLDENSGTETLYIGTDLGVFIRDNNASDWSNFNNASLPNVIVSELEIQYQSNKLIAATYGRGLWSIDLQITSPPTANFFSSDSVFCNIPTTVDFTNTSFYSNSYYWDFGDGNTSTSTSPSHTYTSFGTYTVSLIATGLLGTDSIIAQSLIDIDPNNACIFTLPVSGAGNTLTICNGTLFDVGGPNGNYYDQNDCWVTISPPGSNQITLNFNSFDIEAPSNGYSYCNWDYLEIFDGNDTTAPSLGQFCNALTGSPGTIISSGGALTVLLHSDQAVNGTGFEVDWNCTFPSAPPVSSFLVSDSISCNSQTSFTDLSTNGPTSWLWDFGDGSNSNLQNPTHNYLSSGVYDVVLIASNQFGSDTFSNINAINIIDVNLQTNGATACGDASLLLTSNSSTGTVSWYSDINLQNLVGIGNSYTTPTLNNSATYYAQSVYVFNNLFGGPADNFIGGGSYYQGSKYLIFNNYTSSKLVSVLVYADSDAYRTIELRNSSNAIIEDTTVFIPVSPNGIRIYVNFDLPVQNNMQLGLAGSNNDMYRTSSGAIFPYNISDIVSITGTNAPAGYFYFFYDWEIEKEACISSVSVVEAVIENNSSSSISITSCDTYTWNGNIFNQSGLYIDTSFTSNGCFQIDSLNLIINTINGASTLLVCDSFNWNGQLITQSGNYTQTFQNTNSCDSIHDLIITVINSSTGYSSLDACNSFNWNGQNIINTGSYNQLFTNSVGCDSVHTLDIIINNDFYITDQIYSCSNYTWIDGITYTSSNNIATYMMQSTSGCDSLINLDLILNNNTSSSVSQISCDNYSWPINGLIYDTSGIYIDSVSVDSCLHTDSLLLTIYNSTSSLFVNYACDSYFWNNNSLTQSGVYTNITTNSNGCAHVDSLMLTISNSSSGIHSFTDLSCNSYTWNGNIYNLSGIYYDTISSNNGCDSILKLNLTIIYSPIISINQSASNLEADIQVSQYLWNTGDSTQTITPINNGLYWCVGYNSYGCASDTAFFDFTSTGISADMESSIDIFPNPTAGVVNIQFLNKGSTQLILYNILGEKISSKRIEQKGLVSTLFDLANYANGIYFVEIYNEFESLNYKIILK